MNHNLIKWAAIGAGAWILWRYLSKPNDGANAENKPADPEVSPWWPRIPETQEEIDYWTGKPGGRPAGNPNAEGY